MNEIIQDNNFIREKILEILNKELHGLNPDEIIAEYRNGNLTLLNLPNFDLW
ncbi:MAG: hypothetical protein IPG53_12030 [Ignavibacteriales bacterium]|nr:hypothetical protein [Ignavibacteriales bacterium]